MYIQKSLRGRALSKNYRPSTYVQSIATKYDLEDVEELIRESLSNFLNSPDQELIITENMSDRRNRELVHSIACEMDLRTQSSNDQVRVTKPHNTRSVILLNAQRVKMDHKQVNRIADHLQEFPIDPNSVEEHLGADLGSSDQRRNTNYLSNITPLVPPKAQTSSEMSRFRQRLPASEMRKNILDTIEASRVTIISGGTGCGKTTQVPQFLLEEAALGRNPIRIFCTQPRRLPAIAVAERVARERNEVLGETVGYHIRLEQKTSDNTVLTYCTSGVLLRMLSLDPLATGITHIILDEVHEREANSDYLLIILREALKKRNDLKVILMSATIEGNRDMFEKYFSHFKPCGQCEIPSRLYSVETIYLPEILALTGYMPNSDFVSWNMHSNTFPQVDGFNESQYDHLPTVRTVPDLQSYEHQAPAMQNNWQQPPSHYVPPNQYQPHHSEELTRSNTVPSNLQFSAQSNYYQNQGYYYNNSVYVPTTIYAQPMQQQPYVYENGWNIHSNYYPPNQQFTQSYQQMPMQSSSQSNSQMDSGYNRNNVFGSKRSNGPSIGALLEQWLPNRPKNFDPNYLSVLNKAKFDAGLLIKNYQDRGGQQWSDSIDPDLTLAVISYCMDSSVRGSILVFLPGYDDIVALRDKVNEMTTYHFKPHVYTLHSQMNSQDQQHVFDEAKPGYRKVILSTNIAEASLTIDDVVFVVDCGKVKEKTFEHTSRISQLKVSWIAKSNAGQRAGRAGRCQNGFCFRLYSQNDYEQMLITQVAEMRRSAIHELCLHAKMFAPNGMSVRRFLDCAPEPPIPQAIDRSLEFLEQLGALYNQEKSLQPPSYFTEQYKKEIQLPESKLTNLGRIIASLPLEPQLGRLLLYGVAMSVLHPIITLVAALAHREPFLLPSGEDKQAAFVARDKFARLDYSDHLMLLRVLNAYSDWNSSQITHFCRQNYLSRPALIMISGIRRQLFMELKRLRILPQSARDFDDPEFNHFSSSWPMVQGVIVAGSYPGIAFIRSGTKLRKIHTIIPGSQMASLHPGSSLRRQVNKRSDNENSAIEIEPNIECLVYQELSKIDEGLTLRTVTAVTPLAGLLFSGPIQIQKFVIDDFELVEEDYDSHLFPRNTEEKEGEVKAPDFESDDMIPLRYQRDFYIESDQELTFKGSFRELQYALQLRFKIATYFLKFLEEPLRPFSTADYELLRCVVEVLEIEHSNCNFNQVTDMLPKRQVQRQQPRFSNNQRTMQSNQMQQPRRLPSPPSNKNSYQRSSINKYNKNVDSSSNSYPEPIVEPAPVDRITPPSMQQESTIPNDPMPTVHEPVFDDPVPAKNVPPPKQQQRSNVQESRSKQLIEELDRAQNNSRHMQRRDVDPIQRSEPTASNRNRNEEVLPRRTQAPNNFYRQQGYNQSSRTESYEHNSYEKPADRPFQRDRYCGDRGSNRFNNYNNGRQTRGNSDNYKHKADLYVPPNRRNVDENPRSRPQHDQSKRGGFREEINHRMDNIRLDEEDRRHQTDNGQRKRGETSSFRGNRSSGGSKMYTNQSFKKHTNKYPDNSH